MQGGGCLARSTISFGRESGCQLTGLGRETRTVPPSGGVLWAQVHRDRSPRNQSSSCEGSGLGGLVTSSPMLTAARVSMAVSSGSGVSGKSCSYAHNRRMSHPRTHLQRVGSPDTEDNDRVRHPQTGNDRNQKDTDETAS